MGIPGFDGSRSGGRLRVGNRFGERKRRGELHQMVSKYYNEVEKCNELEFNSMKFQT